MSKRKIFYELIIKPNKKGLIKNRITNSENEFDFEGGRVWKIKMFLEKNQLTDIPWEMTEFVSEKKIIKDHDTLYEHWGKKYRHVQILKVNRSLNAEDKAYLLRHEHRTGRWGQEIADAELNETKDYVIINLYDHEIDYMFSETVKSNYWVYDLKTMKEVIIEGPDLQYRFLHNSSGMRENGPFDVRFSKEDPYKILIIWSDGTGGKDDISEYTLPKPCK